MSSRPVYLLTVPLRSSDGNLAVLSGPKLFPSFKIFQHSAVRIEDTIYEITRDEQGAGYLRVIAFKTWVAELPPGFHDKIQSMQAGSTRVVSEELPDIGKPHRPWVSSKSYKSLLYS